MPEQIEWLQDGKPFIGTLQHLVDELSYASYRFHRLSHPEQPASAWAVIFPTWQALETRYQQDASVKPTHPAHNHSVNGDA